MKKLNHLPIMFDSCGFWPCDPDERNAVGKLKKLEAMGRIELIEITEATDEEQDQVGTPPVIRCESSSKIIACPPDKTPEKIRIWQDIRNTLFGDKNQLTDSDKVDINNIYTLSHHSPCYFVTYDKQHILSKKDIILQKFRVNCVMPQECLKLFTDMLSKLEDTGG